MFEVQLSGSLAFFFVFCFRQRVCVKNQVQRLEHIKQRTSKREGPFATQHIVDDFQLCACQSQGFSERRVQCVGV